MGTAYGLARSLFTFWLLCHAHSSQQSTSQISKGPATDRRSHNTYDLPLNEQFKDFIVLASDNFTAAVLEESEPWIVLLHEGEMLRSWQTMASSVRGLVWLGLLDIRSNSLTLQNLGVKIASYNIQQMQSLVFPYGNNKLKRKDMKMVSSPQEASRLALGSLPDRTTKITVDDLEKFLAECYYLQAPSRFPAIFLSDEEESSSLMRAVALRFHQYFHVAVMRNPQQPDYQRMGIEQLDISLPALFVLIVTPENDQPKANAVFFNTEKMGHFIYPNVARFFFAINDKYRKSLPGANMADTQEIAEMAEIEEIEARRFDIVKLSDDSKRAASRDEL